MSGVDGSPPPSFEWFVSLGNLLTIIISGSAVVGAVYTLIRYLRQNVTQGITDMKTDVTREVTGMRGDMKRDMGYIVDKIKDQEKITNEQIEHNAHRIEEIKTLIAVVERRIEDTKNDTNRSINTRMDEINRLAEKVDQLRDEQNKLNVELARRMDNSSDRMDNAANRMDKHTTHRPGGRQHGSDEDDETNEDGSYW